MPVTAKLSRRFYDRFGDEITNELVDWLNAVDASYQSSLRELNETNFARFDAKLEQRITSLDAKLGQRITTVEAKLEQRITTVEARLEQRIASVEIGLGAKIETAERRMIRWMVTLWSGSILTTAGLLIALLR